jgi:flagellar motor component MotA
MDLAPIIGIILSIAAIIAGQALEGAIFNQSSNPLLRSLS